jgi:steroid 5-alpha reductase family enzyme
MWAGLVILIYVILAWLVSIIQRDTSVVDIFWGAGFVLVSFVFFMMTDGLLIRKVLLLSLVAIWGLRLSVYIGIRNHGKPEDPRYRAWRDKHGSSWPIRSLVTVFLFQGILMWIISLPLLVAMVPGGHAKLIWMDFVGIVLWSIGFLFEAIGDWQLFRFKKDPSNDGKVLDSGLWRYTRHPNYFGEFAIWWGFGFIALTSGHFWVLVSPILVSILVMKFSGVGLLEKSLKDSKSGYRDYIKTTSAFFPWPRRVSSR